MKLNPQINPSGAVFGSLIGYAFGGIMFALAGLAVGGYLVRR